MRLSAAGAPPPASRAASVSVLPAMNMADYGSSFLYGVVILALLLYGRGERQG